MERYRYRVWFEDESFIDCDAIDEVDAAQRALKSATEGMGRIEKIECVDE